MVACTGSALAGSVAEPIKQATTGDYLARARVSRPCGKDLAARRRVIENRIITGSANPQKQNACTHFHAQYAASLNVMPFRRCDLYALTNTTGAAAVL